MKFPKLVKRFGGLIVEVVLFTLIGAYLKPVTDLLTGQQITASNQVLGIIGIVSIIAASILGFLLAQRSYTWYKKASRALETQGKIPLSGEQKLSPYEKKPRALIEVNSQTFSNQDIELDGKIWNKCTFKGCNMIIERGEFSFSYNKVIDCKWGFKGQAWIIAKIIQEAHPGLALVDPKVTGGYFQS